MNGEATGTLTKTAVLIAVVLTGWQVLYWVVGDVAVRGPVDTIVHTGNLLATGELNVHLLETGTAFAWALVLAVGIGLAIGLVLGYNQFAADVFEPVLVAVYSIPKIALYPILLLTFGLGISAKIAFGTIHGVIPIALFTINAVRNVRPVLIKAARVMRLTNVQLARDVLMPAALPEVFTGLRIGFALTLIGTLLGEMFASQRGLGYLLMTAIGLHKIELIMALTLLLVVFAVGASSVLLYFDRRLRARYS